jgi:hypothetical protein
MEGKKANTVGVSASIAAFFTPASAGASSTGADDDRTHQAAGQHGRQKRRQCRDQPQVIGSVARKIGDDRCYEANDYNRAERKNGVDYFNRFPVTTWYKSR